jgi:GNAT superfamily N-acetyltransferase
MSFQPTFPPGLRLQGAAPSDIPIITALLRISETFDAGEPSVTAEDVESEWMHSGFDPAVDALLAFEDGHAIAYAEVPGWRAEATVHPDARGRGIGTAILAWIEKRAVERAVDGSETRVGQTVIDINTGPFHCSFAADIHRGTHRGCCASPTASPSTIRLCPAVSPFDRLIRIGRNGRSTA